MKIQKAPFLKLGNNTKIFQNRNVSVLFPLCLGRWCGASLAEADAENQKAVAVRFSNASSRLIEMNAQPFRTFPQP